MKSNFNRQEAHDSGDTLPEQANVYVPPRPLAQISDHRTIDFKAIRIAAELDPRQAKTQLKLMAPPRRNRGLPLFIFGSAVVLALFGVVIYMAVAGPAPLPLVTTDAPAVPPAPDTARLVVQSAPVGPTTTAAPVATSAPTEPATAAAPSAAKAPSATSHGRSAPRSAPRKAKVVREPWLE
jgi:hypothetical protein